MQHRSYEELVGNFLNDPVQTRRQNLKLINPHHDPRLQGYFSTRRDQLDYLHNRSFKFTIQFVGSHYWHAKGLYKDAAIKDAPSAFIEDQSAFSQRIRRLNLHARYQFSNAAMGYIPESDSANHAFTTEQIAYLRPRKLAEYQALGTKVVFALGANVVRFHCADGKIPKGRLFDAIKAGPLQLDDGLILVPMPHPGALGIMSYLRMSGQPRDHKAQDAAFLELIECALSHPLLAQYLGPGPTKHDG